MSLQIETVPDADAAAARGADIIAARIATLAAGGRFAMAVSGGATPWKMFAALAARPEIVWDVVDIWQADERIAPAGDDDRSLTHLAESLPPAAFARIKPMPVDDLEGADDATMNAAADRYAATLPTTFDLVHLGLGEDGHTASLLPGDRAADVRDKNIAITGEYKGRRRMTITFPVLDHALFALWIVTGAEKARVLRKFRDGDSMLPAAHVNARERVVIADAAAATRL
ncbi:MAG: 6-phosphogluconolactonase [Actinomycetota bacterium]|nr:6-phosphogluconolactonase [Actinomycetota bacterium]